MNKISELHKTKKPLSLWIENCAILKTYRYGSREYISNLEKHMLHILKIKRILGENPHENKEYSQLIRETIKIMNPNTQNSYQLQLLLRK